MYAFHKLLLAATLGVSALGASVLAQEPKQAAERAEHEKFFETKVRPLLAEKCFTCHGEKMQRGKLRLDTLDAVLVGNATGPAIHPGDTERSPLITAIRYMGRIKMPPTGKLSDAEIADLSEWVKMGAPWPNEIQNPKSP